MLSKGPEGKDGTVDLWKESAVLKFDCGGVSWMIHMSTEMSIYIISQQNCKKPNICGPKSLVREHAFFMFCFKSFFLGTSPLPVLRHCGALAVFKLVIGTEEFAPWFVYSKGSTSVVLEIHERKGLRQVPESLGLVTLSFKFKSKLSTR